MNSEIIRIHDYVCHPEGIILSNGERMVLKGKNFDRKTEIIVLQSNK